MAYYGRNGCGGTRLSSLRGATGPHSEKPGPTGAGHATNTGATGHIGPEGPTGVTGPHDFHTFRN